MKQKFFAEFFGTAFLLAIIVGSGIMGETLAQGNEAVALLANSIATGAGLYVLIQCLGSLSGAHFNPFVSLVEAFWGRLSRSELLVYWCAQLFGAISGVLITHIMFQKEIFQIASKDRSSPQLWLSELVATFGLICVIALSGRKRIEAAPTSIALYITAAYWFTASTSFANPAVTLARSLTDTFCGIAPPGVLPFMAAQFAGAILAFLLLKRLE